MTFPSTFHTLSADETENIGALLANYLSADKSASRFVALFGDLGVGKTAFVRGFTGVFAPTARVKSPTFAIVNEYRGEREKIFHFDMYRIEDGDELYAMGFYDYVEDGICLVEWSENIEDFLPERYIKVSIVKDNPQNTESRRIEFCLVGKTE